MPRAKRSRQWFWFISEPKYADKYYAERLGAWLLEDNPQGFLRCWILQREKGNKKEKEHIQGWHSTPEKKGAIWLLRHMVFPGETLRLKICNENIKEQIKYVTKKGADGLMAGHQNYQGM